MVPLFSKQFLQAFFCVPEVAFWKKGDQTTKLCSLSSILFLVEISEKILLYLRVIYLKKWEQGFKLH